MFFVLLLLTWKLNFLVSFKQLMLRCAFSLFSFRGCQILLLYQSLWRHIHTRCSLMLLPWLSRCCNNETGQTPTLSYMDAYSGPKGSLQSTELSTGTWTAIIWLTGMWFKPRPQLLGHCFNHFKDLNIGLLDNFSWVVERNLFLPFQEWDGVHTLI